jgi:hypothetical protein
MPFAQIRRKMIGGSLGADARFLTKEPHDTERPLGKQVQLRHENAPLNRRRKRHRLLMSSLTLLTIGGVEASRPLLKYSDHDVLLLGVPHQVNRYIGILNRGLFVLKLRHMLSLTEIIRTSQSQAQTVCPALTQLIRPRGPEVPCPFAGCAVWCGRTFYCCTLCRVALRHLPALLPLGSGSPETVRDLPVHATRMVGKHHIHVHGGRRRQDQELRGQNSHLPSQNLGGVFFFKIRLANLS